MELKNLELKAILDQITAASLLEKAKDFEFFFRISRDLSSEIKDSKPFKNESSENFSLALKVFDSAGRSGFCRTSVLTTQSLRESFKLAKESCLWADSKDTAVAVIGENAHLPLNERCPPLGGAKFKPDHNNLTGFLLEAESVLKSAPQKLELAHNGIGYYETLGCYFNSQEAMRVKNQSYFGGYLGARGFTEKSATGLEGKPRVYTESFLYGGDTELDLTPVSNKVILETIAHTKVEALNTGMYPIVFSPKSFITLLKAFSNMSNAQDFLDGNGLLHLEDLGNILFSPCFSLYDDVFHAQNVLQTAFDSEGTPTQKTPLIEEGRFLNFLQSNETAKKMKSKATGNGVLGSKSTVTPHFFSVAPALNPKLHFSLSTSMINSMVDSYVLIEDLFSIHAGVRATEGTFSLPFSGFIVSSEGRRSLDSASLSGNFLDVLRNLKATTAETFFVNSGVSPYLLSTELKVTGAR